MKVVENGIIYTNGHSKGWNLMNLCTRRTKQKWTSSYESLSEWSPFKVAILLTHSSNCYEYGPCVGLTRLERFKRAQELDMEPPEQLLEILNAPADKNDPRIRECIFYNTDV